MKYMVKLQIVKTSFVEVEAESEIRVRRLTIAVEPGGSRKACCLRGLAQPSGSPTSTG